MPKRKDWLIIVIALLLALLLFVLTRSGIKFSLPGGNDPMSILTEVPAALAPGTSPEPTLGEPKAYLVVTLGSTRYRPLPIYKETDYRLRQSGGKENVLHVTPDSVYMLSATCDNQSCIKQGTVSFENAHTRVLGNMIICLPNQVVLELITPQEAEEELK